MKKCKHKFDSDGGPCRYCKKTFSELLDIKQAGSRSVHNQVMQDVSQSVQNAGVGIDIINHPELGDTFINYMEMTPLKQWARIAEMLSEQNLMVIKCVG